MKIKIDADEWYPVYSLSEPDAYGGHEVEVTEEQVARWEAATAAFKKAQDEMGEIHEAAETAAAEQRAKETAARQAAEKAERERKAQEQREQAKAREAAETAMWQRIEASGGIVYDAEGNPVGKVSPDRYGSVRLQP